MSTDTAGAASADPADALRVARSLRFAVGVSVAVALAFTLAWPLYFLTPVLATTLLAMPVPAPGLKHALRLFGYIVVAMALGLAFALWLTPFPLAYAITLGVVLFHIYYAANRGQSPFLVLMLLLSVLILPMLTRIHDSAATGFATYFAVSAGLAVVLYLFMHGVFPDPPRPPAPRRAARQRHAGYSAVAAATAARSTAVIWPLAVVFVFAGWTAELLVLVFAAIFSLSPDIAKSRGAGVSSLTSTALGGMVALGVYAALIAVPELHFFVTLVLLVMLMFASAIFSGHRLAAYLPSAVSCVVVMLNAAMDPDVDLTSKLLMRLALIAAATVYVVAGLAVLSAYTSGRRQAPAAAG